MKNKKIKKEELNRCGLCRVGGGGDPFLTAHGNRASERVLLLLARKKYPLVAPGAGISLFCSG